MYDTILVPVDGGSGSTQSVSEAIKVAEQTESDSKLHILSVYGNSGNFEQFDGVSFRVDGLQSVLSDAGRSPERDTKQGPVTKMIVEKASEIDADLIVMATHSRTGVNRYLSGSVTEKTLRHANCPVLGLHIQDEEESEQSA